MVDEVPKYPHNLDRYRGGCVPFGYAVVETEIGKRLIDVPEQQSAMGVMQDYYDAKLTYKAIRQRIKDEFGYDVDERTIRFIVTGIKR